MDRLNAILPVQNAHGEYARGSTLISEASGEVLGHFHPESGDTQWFGDIGHQILGYPAGDVLPPLRMLSEIVFEADRSTFETKWNALLHERLKEVEVRLRKVCGSPAWVRLRQVVDPTRSGWHIVRFQEAHATIEKRLALQEAMRLEAIQTLAGGVAHEFNNHLTPVTGFIELAIEDLGHDHPNVVDLQIALQQVNACTGLIEHIQSYSGSGVMTPRSTDLSQTTGSLIRRAMNLEPGSDSISLEESYEKDTPAVMVDHGNYRKIITQLVRNSLTAMARDGTIRVRTEVVPDAPLFDPQPLGYVRVSISDNGCGMPPDVLRRIRDPFFTTHGRAFAKGMGLPMVHGMMRQADGCIEVTSAVGQGTTTSLYFPLPETMHAVVEQEKDLGTAPAALSTRRVLLADDEDIIRRLMVRVFQNDGWIVQEAHDFNEMLDVVEKDPAWFDLILMDFTMPGPTPEEAVARLRACACDASIMVVTGMAQDERLDGLLEACNGAYVSKPFSPKSLLSSVEEFLGG